MNLESLLPTTGSNTPRNTLPAEKVDKARAQKEAAPEEVGSNNETKENVQSEELLNQIKAITDDGLYSVQFENNDQEELVVKVIDRETQEVIRQIPPEELQELSKRLNDFYGNFVDTVG